MRRTKRQPPAHVLLYMTSSGKSREVAWDKKEHGRPMQRHIHRAVRQENSPFDPIRCASLVNTKNGNLVAYYRREMEEQDEQRVAVPLE